MPAMSSAKKAMRLLCDEFLALRGLKYGFFRRHRNVKKPPLKIYWWNDQPNFGDMVTPDILYRLFGRRSIWSSIDICQFMGAGSILGWARGENNFAWGSGFMNEGDSVNETLVYLAVRGELSRARLPEEYHGIPLGDPGLLANLVYPRGKRTGKIGIVPHFVDKQSPIVRRMLDDSRFLFIDVATSPADVARQISGCSLVLSSSLHGLVFADSFGIPNMHLELSDKVAGAGYKFRDYYSATGREYQKADLSRIFDEGYLEQMRKEWKPVKGLAKLQRGLVKAFPYR
jgi:hypothetical protein